MPTLESVTRSALQEGGGTSITGVVPASVASGDLLVQIPCQNDGSSSLPAFTTPGGLTLLNSAVGTGNGVGRASLFYRTAAGSDSDIPVTTDTTVGGNEIARSLGFRFTDHDGIDLDAGAYGVSIGNAVSGSFDSPSITPTVNGCLIVSVLYAAPISDSGPFDATIPSELSTEALDVGEGFEFHHAVATATQATAGATTPMTWTDLVPTNVQLVAFSFAVKPAASGTEITSSGTPTSGDSSASGTAEREETSSGTPAAQDSAAAGTSERELTSSGTPAAQAAATSATALRTLICSGVLNAGNATVAGTAALALKLTLTAAAGQELRDEDGVLVANLANIVYEWYDKDTDTEGDPDQAGTFSTNASGEATIQLATTSLTAGQYGLLILTHPTDDTIRGVYRIPVA